LAAATRRQRGTEGAVHIVPRGEGVAQGMPGLVVRGATVLLFRRMTFIPKDCMKSCLFTVFSSSCRVAVTKPWNKEMIFHEGKRQLPPWQGGSRA
jgi:hypothetical protein